MAVMTHAYRSHALPHAWFPRDSPIIDKLAVIAPVC